MFSLAIAKVYPSNEYCFVSHFFVLPILLKLHISHTNLPLFGRWLFISNLCNDDDGKQIVGSLKMHFEEEDGINMFF